MLGRLVPGYGTPPPRAMWQTGHGRFETTRYRSCLGIADALTQGLQYLRGSCRANSIENFSRERASSLQASIEQAYDMATFQTVSIFFFNPVIPMRLWSPLRKWR